MEKSKRTLPRHTVLAPQSRRIGAFLFDTLIFCVLSVLLHLFVFGLIFNSTLKPVRSAYLNEQSYSGLITKKGNVGEKLTIKNSDEELMNALQYYYFNYKNNENIAPGKEGSKIIRETPYTVEMFNKEVLKIGENPNSENDTGYYTYIVKNNEFDKTVVGVKKEGVNEDKAHGFLFDAYILAIYDFGSQDYVLDMVNQRNFLNLCQVACAAVTAMSVLYVGVPFLFKDGVTFGKKLFGLAVVNKEGYRAEKWRILLRLVPLFVVTASLIIPVWPDMLVQGISYLTIFLVSFALAMASPSKSALHDYTAGTIVIDSKASIIFDNSIEEEKYIFEEDGIVEEEEE